MWKVIRRTDRTAQHSLRRVEINRRNNCSGNQTDSGWWGSLAFVVTYRYPHNSSAVSYSPVVVEFISLVIYLSLPSAYLRSYSFEGKKSCRVNNMADDLVLEAVDALYGGVLYLRNVIRLDGARSYETRQY